VPTWTAPCYRHCSHSSADQLRHSIKLYSITLQIVPLPPTVRASFNITTFWSLPSIRQSLDVAIRCDLLTDNTAEHTATAFGTSCFALDYSYEKYGVKLVVVLRKEQWRRIPAVTSRPYAAITFFLPCTWSIINEANSAVVMHNTYLLQLGIYRLSHSLPNPAFL